MRCPECEQRNSVASSKCKFCGTKIRRKQTTIGKKLIIGGAVVAVTGCLALSFMLPKLADPGESLTSCAKRVAAGPKSPEDAKRIKTDLDGALKAFLEKFGEENSTKLAARLQQTLPSTAFEVHVVDLPRGLKLVEIDTLLQASDFLVMKGTTETKVFPLPGFEVFDDARAVNDQAGPVLVLIGHSSGQLPHKPHVKTYALLPDFIVDETEKMVPMLKGEGTAKFVGNGADVQVDLSVASMAREEKVSFSSPLSDISIRQRLRWKDAKYSPEYDIGADANAYLFMLGRCLVKPDMAVLTRPVIGAEAARMIKERAGDGLGDVAIMAFSGKKDATSFSLRGKGKEFLITLAQNDKKWQVSKFAVSECKEPVRIASASADASRPNAAAGPTGETTATAAPSVAPEYVTAMAPPAVAPSAVTAPVAPSVAPAVLQSGASSATAGDARKESESRAADAKKKEQEEQTRREEEQRRQEEEQRRKEQEKKSQQSPTGTQSAIIADYLSSPSVRLRAKPSTRGTTLTEIPRGAKLSVLHKENGWYKVSYNGQTGYVYGGLVDFKKPSSVATHTTPSSAYTTAVVTRSMTVRDERRRALAHPQPGDRLVIVSGINRNNKYKVQLSDGRIGYLDKSAVDVKVETPEFVP